MRNRVLRTVGGVIQKRSKMVPRHIPASTPSSSTMDTEAPRYPFATDFPTASSTNTILQGGTAPLLNFTLDEVISACIDSDGEQERHEDFQGFIEDAFARHYKEGIAEVIRGEKEVTSVEGKLYVKHLKKNAAKYLIEEEAIPDSILTSSLDDYVTYPDIKYGHNGDFVRTAYHRTLNDLGHAIEEGMFSSLSFNETKLALDFIEDKLEERIHLLVDGVLASNVSAEVREGTRLFAWTFMPKKLEEGLRVRNSSKYEGREEGANKIFLIKKNIRAVLAEEYMASIYSPEELKEMGKEGKGKVFADIVSCISDGVLAKMEYSDAQVIKVLNRVRGRGLTSTSEQYDTDYGVIPIQKDKALALRPSEVSLVLVEDAPSQNSTEQQDKAAVTDSREDEHTSPNIDSEQFKERLKEQFKDKPADELEDESEHKPGSTQ